VEFRSFLFDTLYLWTVASVYHSLLSFYDFLVLFSPSSLVFLCILHVYLGCTLYFLMIFRLLIKRKHVFIVCLYCSC
jgi:cytochrome b561